MNRLAIALVAAAGCVPGRSDPGPAPGGWTGPGGDPLEGCASDVECGPQVCARDGACYPAASLRSVHVTWTVGGAAATTTGCGDLFIRFATDTGEAFGYAPVPCRNGKYTMDKLPDSYTLVELGYAQLDHGTTGEIDPTTGAVAIDLP